MAANARVELTPTESKSAVLPLHQFAKCGRGRNRLPLPILKKGSKPMTSDLHSKHNKKRWVISNPPHKLFKNPY